MAVCLAVMAGQDPLGRIEALEECRIPCPFAKKPTIPSLRADHTWIYLRSGSLSAPRIRSYG